MHGACNDEKARYKSNHGSPAKPPEGAGDELLDGAAPDGGLGLGEKRRLDEVEIVEEPDPDHTREEVNPTQEKEPSIRA